MVKWIFRTGSIAVAAWEWRTYRARRAEERALASSSEQARFAVHSGTSQIELETAKLEVVASESRVDLLIRRQP